MAPDIEPSGRLSQQLREAAMLQQQGRYVQAELPLREILRKSPDQPQALHVLGLLLHQQAQTAAGIDLLRRAARHDGNNAVLHNNLGALLLAQNCAGEAATCFQQAILLKNDYADAYANLARALQALGRFADATAACEIAAMYRPGAARAQFDLGNARMMQGDAGGAADAFRHAVALDADYAEAHNNLGAALQAQGAPDAAAESFRAALAANPQYAEAENNLGTVLTGQGDMEGAARAFRRALALRPGYAEARSNLLLCLQHLPGIPAAELFAEHRLFAAQHEAPLRAAAPPFAADRDRERRLKIGYVSGDFWRHAVAYFIEPVFAHHDKSRFEIFAYHNHFRRDDYTARIEGLVDHWQPCHDLSDEQLVERIRADRIDILVDLSGHSSRNRLTAFAKKPAPVQITWIGYAGTTGLGAMDYRITDAYLDPPGLTERYHSEKLIRLPGAPAVFQPDPNTPEVNALPALAAGSFTFASLNSPAKISEPVVRLWARILAAAPGARMLLGNMADDAACRRVAGWFAAAGIAPDRLLFQPRVSMAEYLALHHRIDLALDPFPYNGGTTTTHALWMGVPVVTLTGERTISRCGVAILSRAGLQEFIAAGEDEYVAIALGCVENPARLAAIRQALRPRLAASPGQDPATATRLLEDAYRQAWRDWCAAGPHGDRHAH